MSSLLILFYYCAHLRSKLFLFAQVHRSLPHPPNPLNLLLIPAMRRYLQTVVGHTFTLNLFSCCGLFGISYITIDIKFSSLKNSYKGKLRLLQLKTYITAPTHSLGGGWGGGGGQKMLKKYTTSSSACSLADLSADPALSFLLPTLKYPIPCDKQKERYFEPPSSVIYFLT